MYVLSRFLYLSSLYLSIVSPSIFILHIAIMDLKYVASSSLYNYRGIFLSYDQKYHKFYCYFIYIS